MEKGMTASFIWSKYKHHFVGKMSAPKIVNSLLSKLVRFRWMKEEDLYECCASLRRLLFSPFP